MNSSLLLIWRDRDFRTQVEPVRESAHSDTVTFFYAHFIPVTSGESRTWDERTVAPRDSNKTMKAYEYVNEHKL